MLNLYCNYSGKIRTGPLFIKVVCFLLYNSIIADKIKNVPAIWGLFRPLVIS